MKFSRTLCVLTFILTYLCQAQDIEKNDFILLDNIAVNNIVYGINSKSNSTQFTLQICDDKKCYTTRDYVININPQLLINDVLNVIKTNSDTTLVIASVSQTDKDQISELKTKVQAVETKKVKAQKTEVENLFATIDEEKDQYSAKVILNKIIPYQIKYNKTPPNTVEEVLSILENTPNDSIVKNVSKDSLVSLLKQKVIKNDTSDSNKKSVKGIGTLEVIDAKIHFFNNKASSIYIKAKLTVNGVSEKIIIENNSFSVALRYFNKYGSTVSVQNKNRDDIIIDYNDVFDYESD